MDFESLKKLATQANDVAKLVRCIELGHGHTIPLTEKGYRDAVKRYISANRDEILDKLNLDENAHELTLQRELHAYAQSRVTREAPFPPRFIRKLRAIAEMMYAKKAMCIILSGCSVTEYHRADGKPLPYYADLDLHGPNNPDHHYHHLPVRDIDLKPNVCVLEDKTRGNAALVELVSLLQLNYGIDVTLYDFTLDWVNTRYRTFEAWLGERKQND